jgi:GMP synthase-like glutamine amidotransferase
VTTARDRRLRIAVVQHADWETLGLYEDWLAEQGASVTVVRTDLGERLPDWRHYSAVIAMGGPVSVNDANRLGWLRDEIRWVEAAVSAGRPFLGVCLGAQILAAAAGARVYPAPRPEFGVHPVRTTTASFDDPLFGGVPRHLNVFQWHGETFDLPADGVALVESDELPNQAVRIGERAYGLQFHVEVSPALLDEWLAVPSCRSEVRAARGPRAEAELTAELGTVHTRMGRLARRVFTGWVDLVRCYACREGALTGAGARA